MLSSTTPKCFTFHSSTNLEDGNAWDVGSTVRVWVPCLSPVVSFNFYNLLSFPSGLPYLPLYYPHTARKKKKKANCYLHLDSGTAQSKLFFYPVPSPFLIAIPGTLLLTELQSMWNLLLMRTGTNQSRIFFLLHQSSLTPFLSLSWTRLKRLPWKMLPPLKNLMRNEKVNWM